MIQLISGEKGKGKTKILISNVNEDVQKVNGNIVYLDKSNKHMYELSNKIRLINVQDYLITSTGEFLGFICGIISQDHDLEKVYLDSFIIIACINNGECLKNTLEKLDEISEKFGTEFVISISTSKEDIPEKYQDNILVSL